MTTLEQREECLRNHSENGPFPGVGCPPKAKSALPSDPGSTVGQNRRRTCQTLQRQAVRFIRRVGTGESKWKLRGIGREPKPMTADYAEAVRKHRFDLLYSQGTLAALIETNPQSDHLLI